MAVLVACTFKFDRELSPGELRAKVLLNTAIGTTESWEPATNARFRIVGSALEQKSGANGVVLLRNLPQGRYDISITHTAEGRTNPDAILLLRAITIERGGGRDLGTLKLGSTGGVEGRALLNGEPVSNAAIQPIDGTGLPLPGIPLVRSGADGRFSLPYVPSGSLRLHALFRWSVDGMQQTVTADSAEITVPARGVAMTDVLFTAPVVAAPSVLKLETSSPDGTPPPTKITVRLIAEDGTVIERGNLPAGSTEIGSFTPGIYSIVISADGYQDVVLSNVLLEGPFDLGSIVLMLVEENTDLCAADHSGCDPNADCSKSGGSASCSCRTGFTGNGYFCAAVVNGCTAEPPPCDSNASCSPGNNGEALCACNEGFTADGTGCTDDNECLDQNGGCDPDASCTNIPGSRTCACPDGFTGDGTTCTDNDECLANTDNCHPQAICTNTRGGFTCACQDGFVGDGLACEDVNECLTENGGCPAHSTCSNTMGGRECPCDTAYQWDGTTCADVDECLANTDNCDADALCTNTDGGFSCRCNDGFVGDGVACEDVNECETDNGGCPTNATCANTEGTFACPCNAGYQWNGTVCADVDECGDGHGPCDPVATCTNTEGSFTCDCPIGFGGGIICLSCDNPEAHCCETPLQFCSRLGANCEQVTELDACGELFTANCGSCLGGQVCGLATANICFATGTTTIGFTASVLNNAVDHLPSTVVPKNVVTTLITSVVNDASLSYTGGDGALAGWHMVIGSGTTSVVNTGMSMGGAAGGNAPPLSRTVSTPVSSVVNDSLGALLTAGGRQTAMSVASVECLAPTAGPATYYLATPQKRVSNP